MLCLAASTLSPTRRAHINKVAPPLRPNAYEPDICCFFLLSMNKLSGNVRRLAMLLILILSMVLLWKPILQPLPSAILQTLTPTAALHLLPPEYRPASLHDEDHWREANYGLPYLTHIATDHILYCDVGASQSGFEYFRTIHRDLLCVLSGVQYTTSATPSEPQPHKPFVALSQISNRWCCFSQRI